MSDPPDPFPPAQTVAIQKEWDLLRANYLPGTAVRGIVVSRQHFGVFVQVDELPGVTALLEIFCFALLEHNPVHPIQYWIDFPQQGARIEARILWWHREPTSAVRLTQLTRHNWDDLRSRALDDLQKS